MHGQCVHASTGGDAPDLDSLVAAGGHDGFAVPANEDVADVVCMTDKLCDALPALWIPDADDALGATTGQDTWCHI